MNLKLLCLNQLLIISVLYHVVFTQYEPNWDSLDSRPLPSWYDDAKIGIFIHWSVWSVPAAGFNESAYLWEKWNYGLPEAVDFMNKYYSKNFAYPDFAAQFKAEFYDPNHWIDVFNSSGAKYIVFVSKHHEGYCNWPSKYAFNWNSMDVGPKRDLLGDLFTAARTRSDLKIGLYYSLYEWYHPLYVSDRNSNFTKNEFVKTKMLPELVELTKTYKPDVIWTDGDWEAYPEYWQSQEFLTWLYNESPVKNQVVVNDRWGIGTLCTHGGYLTCADKYNPGHLLDRKWENAMTIDLGSWGFRYNMKLENIIKIEDLIREVIQTVSCGGNILINVGPTSYGTLPLIFEERLTQLGQWLSINGEAIYSSKPWKIQNDPFNLNLIWYTAKSSVKSNTQFIIYVFLLKNPVDLLDEQMQLILKPQINCSQIKNIEILGVIDSHTSLLPYHCKVNNSSLLFIDFKNFNFFKLLSKWAWVIKLIAF